jgi:hypothetical protein
VGKGSESVQRVDADAPVAGPDSAASSPVDAAPSGDAAPSDDAAPSGDAAHSDDEPSGLSTPMLLLAGVIGGVYLLYTVGWVVGGLRLQPLASFLVADAMFLPWFVLAIAAPALWFLATWVLTRGRAAWIRAAVLFAGVVLLVPWPFVTVGVIGS